MGQEHEPRILVVDDDTLVRMTLSRAFKNEGFNCVEAWDVQSALSSLQKISFDLVLADINMPEKSGVELLRAVRKNWSKTPVIMMTGLSNPDTADKCLKLGAANYITKPFDLPELRQTVSRSLLKKRQSDALAPVS